MLPEGTLPASLQVLLAMFQPCFTAPSFRTFCALACGFWAQTGRRTVCGMLTGAGLAGICPHHRAHYFLARARWQPGDLGLALARLVVKLLIPAGAPVTVAIDDTLFRRRGRKVWAASWFHDGSAAGKDKTGFGNNWVIAGIIVALPMVSRPVCLPVLAKLVVKGTNSGSRLWLARRMTEDLAAALPGRTVCVVADAAYAGKELRNLPACVTWTTRLRKDAALQAAVFTCLWYTVFGTRPVQVVLVRDRAPGGYDIALVTTDLDASPAQVIERYAARWSIEVAFEDARQVFGAGQARNRTARAVRATIPFTLACQTLAIIWYATAGHDPADVAEHRARAPWYAAKTEPSTADMAAKLRRVLIAAKFRLPRPGQPTPAEISAIRLAWETPAA